MFSFNSPFGACPACAGIGSTMEVDEDMVIVCVVGDLEWDNVGFEAQIVQAMKDVPVRMISYGGSNYNVSLLIKASDKQRALQALSDHLFNNK